MSIHHVVRCDLAGCTSEAPAKSNWSEVQRTLGQGQIAYPQDERPPSWLRAENCDFCSWGCLAKFAASMTPDQMMRRA